MSELNFDSCQVVSVDQIFPAIESSAIQGENDKKFYVHAQGQGSFTGLSYTVPAHSISTIVVKTNLLALTSADIKTLNDLVSSMLTASKKEQIYKKEEVHASGSLSFWSFFTGGAKASYDSIKVNMTSVGLTESQITTIINKLFELTVKMNTVEMNVTVNNTANDYSVGGNLSFYTIAGKVVSGTEEREFRMLADKGTAGKSGEAQAEATFSDPK